MKKLLRSLLLTAVVGAGSLAASAQSETFTGMSGNKYYVDYEKGLVLQLDEKNKVANFVSPQWVVETEITPVWERLNYMAETGDRNYEIFMNIKADFFDAISVIEWGNEYYHNVVNTFQDKASGYIKVYEDAIKRLKAIQDEMANTRNSLNTRANDEEHNKFSFDIQVAIWSLEIVDIYMSDFTRVIDSLTEDVYDLKEEIAIGHAEISGMNVDYDALLDSSFDRINGWLDWLDKNEDTIDETDVEYVINVIEEEISDLKDRIDDPELNPMDYMGWAIDSCERGIADAEYYYNEAYNSVTDTAQRLSGILNNFAGVLFTGANGEEYGMYYYMMDNIGQLVLPDYVTADDVEYRVIGAQSNIFSCVPADFNMEGASLVMPETIRQIHNEAFAIDGLVAVYVPTPECPVMDANCFTTQVYSTATLYVTDGWVAAYKAREPWKNFFAIEPISSTSVEDAIAESELVKVEGGNIVVNAASGANVTVYKVDGSIVYNGEAGIISLPNKGMYIVKVNNKIVKVIL